MLDGLIILASYGLNQGAIGQMFDYAEQAGIFVYMLPFLLIFALVFGIMNQVKLFQDNKAINGIIALVVGLMALQVDLVPKFFSEVFPRLGVGLAIILIILILSGLFIDPNKGALMYVLLGVGVIITMVVLINTAGAVGWSSGYWWQENWPRVTAVVFILAVIGIIVGGSNSHSKSYNAFWPGFGPKQQ